MTDPLFDVHAAALQFHRQRMELLASNIANADTPGYQARDLDFTKVLAQVERSAAAPAGGSATQPGHIAPGTLRAATVYRTPTQPSADGNTVDVQAEQAAYADAALHYQSSLSFIDYRLKTLMTAITGN